MRKIRVLLIAALSVPALCQQPAATPTPTPPSPANAAPAHIMAGSKLYIEPMDGFETYLSAAILKKKVPLQIVDSPDKADFIASGKSYIQKASAAKTIFVNGAPSAGASVTIKTANGGTMVFAYSVDKYSSVHGQQSTAEAVAKHLKESIAKE